MNKSVIKDALEESLALLNEEVESVTIDDLKDDYIDVICKIKLALKEIEE